MITAYYGDNDPYVAEWLRNLIRAGLITPGAERCPACKLQRETAAQRDKFHNDPVYREHRREIKRERDRRAGHYRKMLVRLIVRQRAKCFLCRKYLPEEASEIHIDHLVPLALGGSSDERNLRAVCAPCNETKKAKLVSVAPSAQIHLPL